MALSFFMDGGAYSRALPNLHRKKEKKKTAHAHRTEKHGKEKA
jgi:hypothetical protein